MSVCPNCSETTFPDDLYCGNCRNLLPQASIPERFPQKPTQGSIKCRKCGHMNEPDSLFCELDGTPLSKVPRSPQILDQGGALIMPDQSEISVSRTIRIFGRRDLIKFLKPESMKQISRAHFTIMHGDGAFYLREGAPDRKNSQVWRPSANKISINGVVLESGTKHKLKAADVIDVDQLGLNLTFKTLCSGKD